MKVAVIIVTYNAMKWAEKCFTSIRNSSVPLCCIVVDNGSTDGTQQYIQEKFPEIEITQSNENLGFGKANNLGIEIAYQKGVDFFYLMNQDAWLYENSIENLLEAYQKHPNKDEIGILSPIHLDGSEKKLDIFMEKYIFQNYTKTRLISDMFLNNYKPYYELKFINAAHWLIPKYTIENIGGFNPLFFHYGEDNEYINRLIYHGLKVLLIPNSKAVHDGKQSLEKVDYKKYKNLISETHCINPNIHYGIKAEIKSLLMSTIKQITLYNFSQAFIHIQKIIELYKNREELIKLRKKISKKGHHFLKLQPCAE